MKGRGNLMIYQWIIRLLSPVEMTNGKSFKGLKLFLLTTIPIIDQDFFHTVIVIRPGKSKGTAVVIFINTP